jgi:hypothetical protein
MPQEARRILAPWSVEEGESTYVVRSANGFVISVTYFDDDPHRDFSQSRGHDRRT